MQVTWLYVIVVTIVVLYGSEAKVHVSITSHAIEIQQHDWDRGEMIIIQQMLSISKKRCSTIKTCQPIKYSVGFLFTDTILQLKRNTMEWKYTKKAITYKYK